MKISNQFNNQYQLKKPENPLFRGYFAAPIKELHVQTCYQSGMITMINELKSKCGKHFDIVAQLKDRLAKPSQLVDSGYGGIADSLDDKWGQDNKIFLADNKLLVLKSHDSYNLAERLANLLKLKVRQCYSHVEGGNCFLGQKPNGDNFALIGKDAVINDSKLNVASSLFVKPETLFVLSQPMYHLDMFIRPLLYPNVLVGDPKLMHKFAKAQYQADVIDSLSKERDKVFEAEKYVSVETTIKQLKAFGFNPIRVPGVLGSDELNYMNAIVHQKDDGSLLYITNKSHPSLNHRTGIDFELEFEKYLKRKVPQISEIVFIDGDGFVSNSLTHGGGIHCMTNEMPDFEKWKKMLGR